MPTPRTLARNKSLSWFIPATAQPHRAELGRRPASETCRYKPEPGSGDRPGSRQIVHRMPGNTLKRLETLRSFFSHICPVGAMCNDKGTLSMNVGMRVRGGVLAALMMLIVPIFTMPVSPAAAQSVASIEVEGNRRVEIDTIRSYFRADAAGHLDQASIDDGLKALIATGLFQDVRINTAGGHLVVSVVENPVIGRIAFEGNKKIKDEQLTTEIQSKARGTLSRPMVQSDAQRIAEIYRHSGRYDVQVNPEIIEQPNNRVDLVFTITEGSKTGVKSIEFIGNVAYSSYRLRDIIKTRESNLLSFLGGADTYDPDRVEADRDLIRRY